ncbi:MAG: ketol-acid reductoisomerase, partial [Gammaproteobacteria bacterium]
RGPRVIGTETRAAMQALLGEIQRGEFAAELGREIAADKPMIRAGRVSARASLIETVGAALRARMKRD